MARIEAARVELDLQLQRESVAVERDKVRLEGDKLALEREEIAVKRARVEHASVLELERERNAVALNLIGVHNQHVLPLPNHLTSVYATVSAAWRGWPKKTPATLALRSATSYCVAHAFGASCSGTIRIKEVFYCNCDRFWERTGDSPRDTHTGKGPCHE